MTVMVFVQGITPFTAFFEPNAPPAFAKPFKDLVRNHGGRVVSAPEEADYIIIFDKNSKSGANLIAHHSVPVGPNGEPLRTMTVPVLGYRWIIDCIEGGQIACPPTFGGHYIPQVTLASFFGTSTVPSVAQHPIILTPQASQSDIINALPWRSRHPISTPPTQAVPFRKPTGRPSIPATSSEPSQVVSSIAVERSQSHEIASTVLRSSSPTPPPLGSAGTSAHEADSLSPESQPSSLHGSDRPFPTTTGADSLGTNGRGDVSGEATPVTVLRAPRAGPPIFAVSDGVGLDDIPIGGGYMQRTGGWTYSKAEEDAMIKFLAENPQVLYSSNTLSYAERRQLWTSFALSHPKRSAENWARRHKDHKTRLEAAALQLASVRRGISPPSFPAALSAPAAVPGGPPVPSKIMMRAVDDSARYLQKSDPTYSREQIRDMVLFLADNPFLIVKLGNGWCGAAAGTGPQPNQIDLWNEFALTKYPDAGTGSAWAAFHQKHRERLDKLAIRVITDRKGMAKAGIKAAPTVVPVPSPTAVSSASAPASTPASTSASSSLASPQIIQAVPLRNSRTPPTPSQPFVKVEVDDTEIDELAEDNADDLSPPKPSGSSTGIPSYTVHVTILDRAPSRSASADVAPMQPTAKRSLPETEEVRPNKKTKN